jgi:hypothetical protein
MALKKKSLPAFIDSDNFLELYLRPTALGYFRSLCVE